MSHQTPPPPPSSSGYGEETHQATPSGLAYDWTTLPRQLNEILMMKVSYGDEQIHGYLKPKTAQRFY